MLIYLFWCVNCYVVYKLTTQYLQYYKKNCLPKHYKSLSNKQELLQRKQEILEKVKDITRDGYSLKKIPDNLDTIIIGSGISGLSCGAILSKLGKISVGIGTTLHCRWMYTYV